MAIAMGNIRSNRELCCRNFSPQNPSNPICKKSKIEPNGP